MVPVQFRNNFTGPLFVEGGPKNFKLLLDISFNSSFQKIVLASLLLSKGSYFIIGGSIDMNVDVF